MLFFSLDVSNIPQECMLLVLECTFSYLEGPGCGHLVMITSFAAWVRAPSMLASPLKGRHWKCSTHMNEAEQVDFAILKSDVHVPLFLERALGWFCIRFTVLLQLCLIHFHRRWCLWIIASTFKPIFFAILSWYLIHMLYCWCTGVWTIPKHCSGSWWWASRNVPVLVRTYGQCTILHVVQSVFLIRAKLSQHTLWHFGGSHQDSATNTYPVLATFNEVAHKLRYTV